MTIRQATIHDVEALLNLQNKYHVSKLTEAEKQEKGFVTMWVTPEQFTFMTQRGSVFVAISDDNQLAAYALKIEWAYASQWAIINRLEEALPTFRLENQAITVQNSCQYGPVCIDEDFRGKDILTRLFEAIQKASAANFPIILTFINHQNERSLRAHAKKTPLSIVGDFGFNNNNYAALACRTE